MVMSPAKLGPENNCAGEDQQQLKRQTHPPLREDKIKLLAVSLKGLVAKTN
jgi:hypothetical protein